MSGNPLDPPSPPPNASPDFAFPRDQAVDENGDSRSSNDVLAWAAKATSSAVEHAAAISEQGVIQAGSALDNLVLESRSQTSDLMEVLPKLAGSESDDHASVRGAIERQTATVVAFVEQLTARADRQTRLAEQAEQVSKSIAKLARDVATIATKARLLSLNATIECSRLGESGKAMTVVADELRHVSTSVGKANADIGDLTEELTQLLPNVAQLSAELQQTSGEFRETFAKSQTATRSTYDDLIALLKDTIERGQSRAERITGEAQRALSALTFQDPMVQSLRELSAMLERASKGVDPNAATGADESSANVGEVVMF